MVERKASSPRDSKVMQQSAGGLQQTITEQSIKQLLAQPNNNYGIGIVFKKFAVLGACQQQEMDSYITVLEGIAYLIDVLKSEQLPTLEIFQVTKKHFE